jgi:dipeptidyl aminopeptidase/acylaminoacyl peptidase
VARATGTRLSHRFAKAALAGAALVALLLGAIGCAADPAPAATPTPTPTPTVESTGPLTVRSLIEAPAEAPTLTVTGPAAPIAGETAEAVAYTSGGLTVTGVVRTPAGEGPFPAVVVVHGAVDPTEYESGGDVVPTQRALVDAGYVVFAPDLRGYAGSDPAAADGNASVDPNFGFDTVLDWGRALDVVNALRLVRGGAFDQVDPDHVGLLGHSLGGLLSLDAAVIAPGASDMVVALSAPASDFVAAYATADPEALDSDGLSEVGTPADNPQYWTDVSPATFFDRATEPLLLIHGGDDPVAPAESATATAEAWRAAGNPAEAIILDGGDHHLEPRRAEADAIVVTTFDSVLRPG